MSLDEYDLKKVALLLLGFFLFVGLVLGSGAGVYYFQKYKKSEKVLGQLKSFDPQNSQELIKTVGKLIRLPEGETPTIATVLDKTQLQSQEFFKNAENGDKILVYKNAKKALLYRPSQNQLIEVGPVKFDLTPSPSPPVATSSPKIIYRPITISPTLP